MSVEIIIIIAVLLLASRSAVKLHAEQHRRHESRRYWAKVERLRAKAVVFCQKQEDPQLLVRTVNIRK